MAVPLKLPKEIEFEVKDDVSIVISILKLENTSKTEWVAYKVKTTAPKRYSVRPNVGVINPSEITQINVTLNLARNPKKDSDTDKFQVLAIIIPPGDKPPKPDDENYSDYLRQIWDLSPTKVVKDRIRIIIKKTNEKNNSSGSKETKETISRPEKQIPPEPARNMPSSRPIENNRSSEQINRDVSRSPNSRPANTENTRDNPRNIEPPKQDSSRSHNTRPANTENTRDNPRNIEPPKQDSSRSPNTRPANTENTRDNPRNTEPPKPDSSRPSGTRTSTEMIRERKEKENSAPQNDRDYDLRRDSRSPSGRTSERKENSTPLKDRDYDSRGSRSPSGRSLRENPLPERSRDNPRDSEIPRTSERKENSTPLKDRDYDSRGSRSPSGRSLRENTLPERNRSRDNPRNYGTSSRSPSARLPERNRSRDNPGNHGTSSRSPSGRYRENPRSERKSGSRGRYEHRGRSGYRLERVSSEDDDRFLSISRSRSPINTWGRGIEYESKADKILAMKAQDNSLVKEKLKLAENQKLMAFMIIAFLIGIIMARWILNNN